MLNMQGTMRSMEARENLTMVTLYIFFFSFSVKNNSGWKMLFELHGKLLGTNFCWHKKG